MPAARLALRAVLTLTAGSIRVEGHERLAALRDPAIFALSHHSSYEAIVAPAALVALRSGRRIRFLVDWMFLELPFAGWLMQQIDPIAIYRKPARFGWREGVRRAGWAGAPAFDRALTALATGSSIGLYPEGTRNRDPWHLAPGRRGLGKLALRSGAPVVPVGLDFPSRDRLLRTPRLGRLVLRIGEPVDTAAHHEAWRATAPGDSPERRQLERALAPAIADQVHSRLALLARKIHLPREKTAMSVDPVTRSTAQQGSRQPEAPAARVTAERVSSADQRAAALAVVAEVYGAEKGWISDAEAEIPASALTCDGPSWFLARVDGETAGVVRLTYDPALELPEELGLEIEGSNDLARLQASGRFVEIGRLMIAPRFRSRTAVVLALMRAALAEVVERGYTHLLTVVFEDDPHSPYHFHTRVLGFERIGTHRRGELASASRRIILTLDIARSYLRMRPARARLLKQLTSGFEDRILRLSESGVV